MADKKTKKSKTRDGKDSHQGPVLCAIDFSDDSRAAIKWAHQHAGSLGIHLLVLHVVHDPLNAPGYYKQAEGKHLRSIEDIAETMVREFVKDELGIDPHKDKTGQVKMKLVNGVPVPRILKAAEKVDARSIVMGSQGLTGLKYLLLGSKAEQVVRLSPIPVTIVKEPKKK